MGDIDSISFYLKVLGLPQTKIPSIEKVRAAFRQRALERHPDKAGPGSTQAFQDLNEACAKVLEFLSDLPNTEESVPGQDEYELALLKMFKNRNDVKYNANSITITLDSEWGEDLVVALEQAVGPRRPLEGAGGGIIMQTKELKVKHTSKDYNYGSLTIRMWLTTQSGIKKMVIEGKAYMAFISQALIFVLKDAAKHKANVLGLTNDAHQTSSALSPANRNTSWADQTTEETAQCTCEIGKVTSSFHKIEQEIVSLRNELISRTDGINLKLDGLTSSENHPAIPPPGTTEIMAQIESMQKQLSELNTKATNVTNDIETNSDKLVDIKTSLDVVNHVVAKENTLITVSQGVGLNQAKLDKLQTSQTVLQTTLTSIDKSLSSGEVSVLKELQKMNTNMSQYLQEGPSVTQTSKPSPSPAQQMGNESAPEIETKPKAIIFTSSVGKLTDIAYMSRHIDCQFTVEPCYYIERNETSTDPDCNLRQKLETCVTNETKAVIIQVGSNEISDLDTANSPMTTLHAVVSTTMNTLLELAQTAAGLKKCQVYVSSLPPRYDEKEGQLGLKSKLSSFANAILTTNTMLSDNVHLIEHTNLQCSGKARNEMYAKDGIHLTKRGTHIMNTSWIVKVAEIQPELVKQQQNGRGSDGNQGHGHGSEAHSGQVQDGHSGGDHRHGGNNTHGGSGDSYQQGGRQHYNQGYQDRDNWNRPPRNERRGGGWNQRRGNNEGWGGGYRRGRGGFRQDESEAVRSLLDMIQGRRNY